MKRALVLAVVCLGLTLVAGNASASCYGTVTTYYGFYAIDGSTFCYWGGGPPQTPDIIGQKEVDCNNNVTTWGNTSCEMYEPTVTYFDCECNYASAEQQEESQAPACAADVASN